MYVAIEVEQLAKRYPGERHALRDVTFHVEEGEIFALRGGDGAGKTTAVRILTGVVPPTEGRARVAGVDVVERPWEARARTGVTLKEAALDGRLTGREFLGLVASLWGLPRPVSGTRADDLLALFDLTEVGELPLGIYPDTMRRRLDLAASLVWPPEVLLLDEPTTGLAPHSRQALWDEIRRIRADGITVLFTTRHREEAQALADRMLVLQEGEIAGLGATREEPGEAA